MANVDNILKIVSLNFMILNKMNACSIAQSDIILILYHLHVNNVQKNLEKDALIVQKLLA